MKITIYDEELNETIVQEYQTNLWVSQIANTISHALVDTGAGLVSDKYIDPVYFEL